MSELTPHWVEKKAIYRRRKHPVQKPWGGAENGLFCWTGSLARWLEHSREGVFSYKSNQHWGSDLDMSFFFFFLSKRLILLFGSHWMPERGLQRQVMHLSCETDYTKAWRCWLIKALELTASNSTDITLHESLSYLWFQQDPIPSRWGGPLCSHFTYEKAKFVWDTAAQHAHVARKRWRWN